MPVAGLLDDRSAAAEERRLAADLVAHRALHRPQRVDVLRLRAGAQGRLGRRAQRQVDVAAQRALLHLHVADAQRAQQVAQRRDVRLGHLRGVPPRPRDRLGDDLDERDAGAVVVDEGVVGAVDATGGAAQVRRLAGVLLHVGALDLDPERQDALVGLDVDVEPAVEADRLVVLRRLEVLRHVRVEVVLPREAAPLGDLAVQRQPDPHRRLHRRAVERGQRARQPQAGRAGLRVGRRAELRGAAAEHLRGGAELDVHLEAEDGVVRGDGLVVRHQRGRAGGGPSDGGHSDAASFSSGPPQRSASAASSAAPTR